MNDDELVQRLRRALHTEADNLTPGLGTPRVTPVAARPMHRLNVRNSGYVLLAVAAVIAAAVTISINLTRSPHDSSSRVLTTAPPSRSSGVFRPHRAGATTTPPVTTPNAPATTVATTPSTTPATTVRPDVASVGAGFEPLSVTFGAQNTGWVLGVQRCGLSVCLRLASTVNDGQSWQLASAPPLAGLAVPAHGRWSRPDLQVRFANASDGWIYGMVASKPVLYWTADGGSSWTAEPLAALKATAIEGLETADGSVQLAYLTAGGFGLATASVDNGPPKWTAATLGSPARQRSITSLVLTVQDGAGWALELHGTNVVSGARLVAGTWQAWIPPCTDEPGLMAASTSTNLVAVCGAAGDQYLERSSNGGQSFTEKGRLDATGVTGVATSAAATLLATQSGTVLYTVDSPTAVHPGSGVSAPSATIVQIGFENAAQGIALTTSSTGGELFMTFNAGQGWQAVNFQS